MAQWAPPSLLLQFCLGTLSTLSCHFLENIATGLVSEKLWHPWIKLLIQYTESFNPKSWLTITSKTCLKNWVVLPSFLGIRISSITTKWKGIQSVKVTRTYPWMRMIIDWLIDKQWQMMHSTCSIQIHAPPTPVPWLTTPPLHAVLLINL